VRPRFREGEVVRLPAGAEAVVDGLVGADEDGEGWLVLVRIRQAGGTRSLRTYSEGELEPTGFAETDGGERVPASGLPPPDERVDILQLRLVTDLTDGVAAARVADDVETGLRSLAGESIVTLVAERHWNEPYAYEFDVTLRPLGPAVDALHALAAAGGEGWLGVSDDGWRCDLWWNADESETVFLAPEVRGAEVTLLPWGSPRRRPEEERPLVAVLDA